MKAADVRSMARARARLAKAKVQFRAALRAEAAAEKAVRDAQTAHIAARGARYAAQYNVTCMQKAMDEDFRDVAAKYSKDFLQ